MEKEQLGKQCSQCHEFQPLENFPWNGWRRGRRVRRADCNRCRRIYMRGRWTMKANMLRPSSGVKPC